MQGEVRPHRPPVCSRAPHSFPSASVVYLGIPSRHSGHSGHSRLTLNPVFNYS